MQSGVCPLWGNTCNVYCLPCKVKILKPLHCHSCHHDHCHPLHHCHHHHHHQWWSQSLSPSPAGHIAVDSSIVAEDLHLHFEFTTLIIMIVVMVVMIIVMITTILFQEYSVFFKVYLCRFKWRGGSGREGKIHKALRRLTWQADHNHHYPYCWSWCS